MDKQQENWIKKTKRLSAIVSGYLLSEVPDDSFGWGARMSALAGQLPDENISGLLLTGPDGCGKHTCVAHFLSGLDPDIFEPIFLIGSNLKSSAFASSEMICSLLDDFYDRGKGLCLVLDRPEDSDINSEILGCLCEAVCEYHLKRDEYPPFFVIIIKSDPLGVPALLSSRLLQCNMTLPTLAQRRAFIEAKAAHIKKCADLEKIIQHTDGFSYSGILNLIRNIELELDSKNALALDSADLEELIDVRPSSGIKADIGTDILKKADEFVKSFQAFSEQMANKEFPAAVFAGAEQRSTASGLPQGDPAGSINLEDERKKAESMPVKQLASELFGEEFVENELCNN